ncbi:MAG: SDR family NAD(P)-dependent oxidoreductase [Chitinophagales bacterium]|nr:SDR family NAD(P)-dependent oxidoreductase [Chitinophagales bacterium]
MKPGKIIIIGASSGMGRKMAELYAGMGNKVGITGRRDFMLREVQQQFPENIFTECFDVTQNENISRLESLENKLGGLDILIISAGTGEPGKELKWEWDKQMIDTNVYAFAEIANWAFNFFTRQDHGHLVTISSVAAERGMGWAPAYSASKSFQTRYFEGLSVKAYRMKKNIDITCIEPGFVKTRMAMGNKLFWVVPVEKAAKQIIHAIEKKKRKAYISKRWRMVAAAMRIAPYSLYKKFV